MNRLNGAVPSMLWLMLPPLEGLRSIHGPKMALTTWPIEDILGIG
jgi:hypothetical protein